MVTKADLEPQQAECQNDSATLEFERMPMNVGDGQFGGSEMHWYEHTMLPYGRVQVGEQKAANVASEEEGNLDELPQAAESSLE